MNVFQMRSNIPLRNAIFHTSSNISTTASNEKIIFILYIKCDTKLAFCHIQICWFIWSLVLLIWYTVKYTNNSLETNSQFT